MHQAEFLWEAEMIKIKAPDLKSKEVRFSSCHMILCCSVLLQSVWLQFPSLFILVIRTRVNSGVYTIRENTVFSMWLQLAYYDNRVLNVMQRWPHSLRVSLS